MPGPVHKDRYKASVKLQEDVKDILKDGRAETIEIIFSLTVIHSTQKHRVAEHIIKPK